jgi:ethanolamine utilization protein EutN
VDIVMQIGRVVGQAVATVKHPSLKGWRLLLVQLLTAGGGDDGEPLLAIDSLGAGVGDRVMLCNDGAGAREMVKDKNSPVRWFVMGLCDA